jgi:predicted MPP superfamily phosphohydrolase
MTTILHISDVHFGWEGENPSGKAERKVCLDSLLSVLSNLDSPWKPSIICLSGDIGWRGAASDYSDAKTWVDSLLKCCGLDYGRIIVCVGNHDIDRKIAEKVPRPASTIEADKVLQVPIEEHFIRPFQKYNDFCKSSGIPAMMFGGEESYLAGAREIDNMRFVILNSAWFAKDNEDKGKLRVGLPHMKYMEANSQLPPVQFDGKGQITIALLHHPSDWLHEEEKYCYSTSRPSPWDYLAYRCHILLTGHTHGAPRRADRIAGMAHHFTGGSAYAGAAHFNSFQLIQLQQDKIVYRWFEFDPQSPDNKWKSSDSESLSLVSATEEVQLQPLAEMKPYTNDLRSALVAYTKRYIEQKSRLLRPFGILPQIVAQHVSVRVSTQHQEFDLYGSMVRKEKTEHLIPFYNAAREARRTLLLGDLGAGKSTLAANFVLETIERSETAIAALIPVKFLRLDGHFTQRDLLHSIDNYINTDVAPNVPEFKISEVLNQRIEVLLVFDGLDELARDVAGRLLSKAAELPENWPTIQIVATARPVEMTGVSYADWKVIYTVPLDDSAKKQFIKEELIADGTDPSAIDEKVSSLFRTLKDLPSLDSLATSPLAVRLVYPRICASSASSGTHTLGELLYELLLERLGGWQKRDDKPYPYEHLETVLPTPEAKAEYLAVLAQKGVEGVRISVDEAKSLLEEAALTIHGANRHSLAEEALSFFEWLGFVLKGELIEFPLQPLAEVSAAVGLLKQWKEQHGNWTLPDHAQWRIVSFAAAIARRRGSIDVLREPIELFINSLLKEGRYKIPAACYIVTEASDPEIAQKAVQGFESLGHRPLTLFGDDERRASARNVAKTLWIAGDVGFDWLFSRYLDPRYPLPHAGSGTIQEVFMEWTALAKGKLSPNQRQLLSKLVQPYLATGEASFFGVLNALVALVPESFGIEDRIWYQLQLLDNKKFTEEIKDKLFVTAELEINRELINDQLLYRVVENQVAGELWLDMNPDVDPPYMIIRSAFQSMSLKPGHRSSSPKIVSECRKRLGENRWLRFARWMLSEDNNKVAVGAAIALNGTDEYRLSILDDVLMGAMHDGGYIAEAEKILAALVNHEGDKGARWLALRMANSNEWGGGHSGWWRVLLSVIEQLEDGPQLMAACARCMGEFILPRYPEVREAFSRILNGARSNEFRDTLRDKLPSLDPSLRRGAAVILVATDPRTEAEALFVAVRSRAEGMFHHWHEWESFCLTLKFSPSVLELLKSKLHLLEQQSRAFALIILAKAGVEIEPYRNELVSNLQKVGNWHLSNEPVARAILKTEETFRSLVAQLDIPCSEGAARAAEWLLDIHSKLLTPELEAKCIAIRSKPSGWSWDLSKLMIRIVHDIEFASAIEKVCAEIEGLGSPCPFLGLVARAVGEKLAWKDIVWAMLCDDSGRGISSEADTSGQTLMEFGFVVEEHRKSIGEAAKSCLNDPRMKQNRWSDAYQWLAVIADEFIGLPSDILQDALKRHSPIQCSAAAALIARLGKVPEGVVFDRGVRRRPAGKKNWSSQNTDRESLLLLLKDYARDSDKLHPSLLDAITDSLFLSPYNERTLIEIAFIGKPGALVSLTLRFCYGVHPNLAETIPLLDIWGMILRDEGNDPHLKRLNRLWTKVRESVIRDDDNAAREYLAELDDKLLEGSAWELALAFEILRVRGALLKEHVNIVFRKYAHHSSFLHEALFRKLAEWLSGELDDALKVEVMSATHEAIVILNEARWDSSDGSHPNTWACLLFSSTQWAFTGMVTEESKSVFFRGLKFSFEQLTSHRGKDTNLTNLLSDLAPLWKKVPPEILGATIRDGLTVTEPAVSTFCRLIQSYAEFMEIDRSFPCKV